MGSDFERALAVAKYVALPLPRAKSGPTTIISFHDGDLLIVRNQHSCIPDPPITITEDPSVDLLTYSREFNFDLNGIVGFFAKIFGVGATKAELDVKLVRKATVQMGGLAHCTVETGALIDYFSSMKATTSCMRDILDKDHLTIVAALRANTFTYTFQNSSGVVVKLTGPEAQGLFKVDASVDVSVSSEGKIVVTAPAYVGYIAWNGKQISKEIDKTKKAGSFALKPSKGLTTPPQPFLKANTSTINLVEKAMSAADIREMRISTLSMGRLDVR